MGRANLLFAIDDRNIHKVDQMENCLINFREIMKYLEMLLKRVKVFAKNNIGRLLVVAIVFGLWSNTSCAQSVDSIFYFIPTAVKTKISDYLKQNDRLSAASVYEVLSYQNDTTQILISRSGESPSELKYLVKNGNRYIKLNGIEIISVVLRSDFLFSDRLHSVKKEGDPFAVYTHKLISLSGYLIEFSGLYEKTVITNASYYQQ
jgi:hypothetical protein